jgi:hypothetical protein
MYHDDQYRDDFPPTEEELKQTRKECQDEKGRLYEMGLWVSYTCRFCPIEQQSYCRVK